MKSFKELAQARYSLKAFSGKPVEEDKLQQILETGNIAPTAKDAQDKLQQILETGNIAPTAKDAQSHRIYVLQSPEALEKANAATPCIYGAATVLLFTFNKEEAFTYPGQDALNSGAEDASIVATHIMLQAKELGVDSCWVNFFEPAKVCELFTLPENEVPVLLMPLGYPKEGAGPLTKHMERKPLADTVKYL